MNRTRHTRESIPMRVSSGVRALCELGLCLVLATAFFVGLSVDTKAAPLAWYYGGGGGPTIFVEVGDSIQDAIDSAGDGWTIQLAYGIHYGHDINLGGRAITLRGAVDGYGAAFSTINALENGRVFECTSGEGAGTIFKNLVISFGSVFTAYGENFAGGGVYCIASSPSFENCTFQDNEANIGGGLSCDDNSSPTLSDCTFTDNWAEQGGGMSCVNNSNPLLDGCLLKENEASSSGGGMFIVDSSSPTLMDTILCSNTPDQVVGTFIDAGGNCIANDCYLDCNGNGIPDECDIADGRSSDCNGNGVPDECGQTHIDSGVQWAPVNGESTEIQIYNVVYAPPNEDVRLEVVARADLDYSNEYYTITIGDFNTQWRNHRQCTPNNRNDYPIFVPAEEWNAAISGSTITVELTASVHVNDHQCQNTIQITGLLASVEGDSDGDGVADCNDPCPGIPYDCDADPTELEIIPGMSIARAMDLVTEGGVINLAAGTYPVTETIDPRGKALTLRGAVDVDGVPTTVLDGLGERSVLACWSGEGPDTVFENLLITHGYEWRGGGMLNDSSSPTLINCWFVDNVADYGGGMFNENSGPTLEDCVFTGNTAVYDGGGMYCYVDSPVYAQVLLTNCTFYENVSSGAGGISLQREWNDEIPGSNLFIFASGCDFTSNDGKGVFFENASGSFYDCLFEHNVSYENGGGVEARDSGLTFSACTFSGNDAHADGGGLHLQDDSTAEIIDCIFEENYALFGGGISARLGSAATVTRTSIRDNVAFQGGGLFVYPVSSMLVSESVVCNNDPNQIHGSYDDGGGNCISIDCTDSDGDGTLDCLDGCPDDPFKTDPGLCGCGIPDDDSDGDGVPDCFDICEGHDDGADSDGDGIPDGCDSCPLWPGDCSKDAMTLFASPEDSIQEAILVVPHGGTIQLEIGTYLIPAALNPGGRVFTLAGATDGDGELLSVLDAASAGRVIECVSGEGADTIFQNLIITGGSAEIGGGVYCSASSPSFIGCSLFGNVAVAIGGGIYNTAESMPFLGNCFIQGNTAGDAGGGVFSAFSSLPVFASTLVCGNVPDQISGPFDDAGANCQTAFCESCACFGDLTGDGVIDGADMGMLLADWGADSNGDLNNDGTTDGGDLGLLLSLWGSCPNP